MISWPGTIGYTDPPHPSSAWWRSKQHYYFYNQHNLFGNAYHSHKFHSAWSGLQHRDHQANEGHNKRGINSAAARLPASEHRKLWKLTATFLISLSNVCVCGGRCKVHTLKYSRSFCPRHHCFHLVSWWMAYGELWCCTCHLPECHNWRCWNEENSKYNRYHEKKAFFCIKHFAFTIEQIQFPILNIFSFLCKVEQIDNGRIRRRTNQLLLFLHL